MEMIHKGLWGCVEGTHLYKKPNANAHVRAAKLVRRAWQDLNKAYEDDSLMRRLFGFKLNTYKNSKNDKLCQYHKSLQTSFLKWITDPLV
jgi:hypothetical protein